MSPEHEVAPGTAPAWPALKLLVATAWKAGRWLTVAGVGSQLVVALGHIGAIYGGKVLVDGAIAQDLPAAFVGGALIAASMSARQICSWADTIMDLRERTAMGLEAQVVDLAARLPGIEHHERPQLLDQLQLVRERRHALGDVVMGATAYLSTWVSAIASVVLLASVHPLLLLVITGAAASVIFATKTERLMAGVEETVAQDQRLTHRIEELARDPRFAGELRLQRLAPLLLARHREAAERAIATEEPVQIKAMRWVLLGVVFFVATQAAAIAWTAVLAARGQLSPGDLVLAIGLVRRAASQVSGVVDGYGYLLNTMRSVRRLAWLQDEVLRAERRARSHDALPAPVNLQDGLRLEAVTFRYPGTEAAALRDVSLHLKAGTTVALVGENGAGKSTLVKLLLRLYEPERGRILVEGVDLQRIDVDQWRARASGAFQDPARFELVAREVVGVGDVARLEDVAAVTAAVAAAGAESTVASLPAGLETRVGPSFDDGVELSGGQWQLLALARAMMRKRPLLLVLDEPTAALDPGREHALFERYAKASQLAASETGGITILVSHRFSTVQMADTIVVIDNGRVIEHGPHTELINADGLYAELFRIQAKGYR